MKTVIVSVELRVNDAAKPEAIATYVDERLKPVNELQLGEVVSVVARDKYRVSHADHCAQIQTHPTEPCTCGADEANQ